MTAELSENLEELYIQSLEIDMIEYLSHRLSIDNRQSMDIYYNSKLCQQIHSRQYDIQYLDYKYLAEDLIENELTAEVNLKTVTTATK